MYLGIFYKPRATDWRPQTFYE